MSAVRQPSVTARREFVREHFGKMPSTGIAARFGVASTVISLDRRILGIERKCIRWTDAMRATATELYLDYRPISEIAEALGLIGREDAIKSYVTAALHLSRDARITCILRRRPHLRSALDQSGPDGVVAADAAEDDAIAAAKSDAEAADAGRRADLVASVLQMAISRREKILLLRSNGITLEAIGQALRLTRERVRQIEGDVRPAPRGGSRGAPVKFPAEAVAEAYRQAKTGAGAARLLGCSVSTVYKALRSRAPTADDLLVHLESLSPEEQEKFLAAVSATRSARAA